MKCILNKNIFISFAKKTKQMSDYFKSLIEHASSQGYKSNTVKPLIGGVIVCFAFSMVAFWIGAYILSYICMSLGGILVICFLFAYFICLYKDPNLLRSERYNLEKTAIEKAAITGDSTAKHLSIKMPQTSYVIDDSSKND